MKKDYSYTKSDQFDTDIWKNGFGEIQIISVVTLFLVLMTDQSFGQISTFSCLYDSFLMISEAIAGVFQGDRT